MKTADINRNAVVNFNPTPRLLDKKGQIHDLRIVRHEFDASTGRTTLILSSRMFDFDNYKLLVRDNQIGLVIMEHIEFNRPVYLHHYNWQNFSHQAYDRFHSASIRLPGERYHLVSHRFIPEKNLLQINLSNSSFN